MEWNNAEKQLPLTEQEVLISVNNEKYIAVYDFVEKGFKVKGKKLSFFAVKDFNIYWMPIEKPKK
jgi:hypothetical protein